MTLRPWLEGRHLQEDCVSLHPWRHSACFWWQSHWEPIYSSILSENVESSKSAFYSSSPLQRYYKTVWCLHFAVGHAIWDTIPHQYTCVSNPGMMWLEKDISPKAASRRWEYFINFRPSFVRVKSEPGEVVAHKVCGAESAHCGQIHDAIEGLVSNGHSVLVLADGPCHDTQVGSGQGQTKNDNQENFFVTAKVFYIFFSPNTRII